MRSILRSHMMAIENPQNVHEICFQAILMPFRCDCIMFDPQHVKLLFCKPIHCQSV